MTDTATRKLRQLTIKDHRIIANNIKEARSMLFEASNIIQNDPMTKEWKKLYDAERLLVDVEIDMKDNAWDNGIGKDVDEMYNQ